MKVVADWRGYTSQYRYDAAGRLVKTLLPNQTASSYQYDASSRLEGIAHTLNQSELSSFEYAYDPLGNRTAVTETVQPPAADLIFSDDFEAGDFSAWSGARASSPPDLTVTAEAGMVEQYGMRAAPVYGRTAFAYDNQPQAERHYLLRLYFDPNNVQVGGSTSHYHTIFKTFVSNYSGGSPGTPVFALELRKTLQGVYQVRSLARNDAGFWHTSSWRDIANAANTLELEWKAASAPGANNGSLSLWVNNPSGIAVSLVNIDNDTLSVESAQMGAVDGVDPMASGWYCFDAFKSRRELRVGQEPQARDCGQSWLMDGQNPEGSAAGAALPVSGTLWISDTQALTDTTWVEAAVISASLYLMASQGISGVVEISATLEYPLALPEGMTVPESIAAAQGMLPLAAATQTVIQYTYDPLKRLRRADYSGGSYFEYSYDAVGNRLEEETPGGTVVYVYDHANRLTSAGGVSYTWDDNGNLLNDGSYSYTYTSANRLATASPNGSQITHRYFYNGLGDRLRYERVVGASTTRVDYTIDIASNLTQVLATSGTGDPKGHRYLYGLGRISQETPAQREYFLGDALGSVRQLVDRTGELRLGESYEPYGEVLSSSGDVSSSYAFTGEWLDSTGLIFLRARSYDPRVGRFISRDLWGGDYLSPLSLNSWNYGNANPVNHLDPSGQCFDDDLDGSCDNFTDIDYRDLTEWLYREMINNAKEPEVRRWNTWNSIWKTWSAVGGIACGVRIVSGQPVITVGGGIVFAGGNVFHATALYEFGNAVKNGAIWDFKDEIGIRLGPGITLCSYGECRNSIEYSVPGNIHFAYIGGASGIFGSEVQAGAGWAEKHDPAHDPNSQEYADPYDGSIDFGTTPWDPNTWNLGDEPLDHEAVTFGLKLWDKYKANLTLSDFKREIEKYLGRFAQCSPNSNSVRDDVARNWPYSVGYFNNEGIPYLLDKGRCP